MSRIRITNRRNDGSKSTDPLGPIAPNIPFIRGKHLQVTILNDDGTESPFPPFKSLDVFCPGRLDAVTAVITVYDPDLVLECDTSDDPDKLVEAEIRMLKARLALLES